MKISGKIVRGKGEGRLIGYPTANLDYSSTREPESGVYAVRATLNGIEIPAAAVVGMWRLPNGAPSVEVHLLGGDRGDMYARELKVRFIKKIRGLQTFSSRDELCAQIEKDLQEVRASMKEPPS